MALLYISDLKENYSLYKLPRRFAECLPETCSTCGAVMAMSSSLTGLHCTNPRCQDKLIMRIRAICTDLGILDFGESTIQKFLNYWNVTNPLGVFGLKTGMIISTEVSQDVSAKIVAQIEEKNHFLLWEYVRVANLPHIQTSAREIFKGYTSLEEAYNDIESGGVDFIQKKLGIISEGEISIRAMKIYTTLKEFKSDLFEFLEDINFVDMSDKKELNVVCSDEVGFGFKKKAEFYAFINSKFADKVHVNFLPSVTKNIDYLVWAGADGSPARYTGKVKTVEGYNLKGSSIPIVTAEQFIEEMRKLK